jgi:hypothetical protein
MSKLKTSEIFWAFGRFGQQCFGHFSFIPSFWFQTFWFGSFWFGTFWFFGHFDF